MSDNVSITPGVGAPIAARNFGNVYYQVVIMIDEAINHESDATYDYYAFALPGTSTAVASWKVFRVNMTTNQKQYADGNASYDNIGIGMSGLTYS